VKRILPIILLLVLITSSAHAALTKAVEAVDAWQSVANAVVAEGTTLDISPNYQSTLYIDAALITATAETVGATITVEISSAASGDSYWCALTSFGGPTGTANPEAITNNPLAAGSTTITCASTTGYALDGGWRLILDSTVANSELVKQVGLSANTSITALDGTTTEHANTAVLYNIVTQYVVAIPDTAVRVRVIYNNSLGADDIAVRCRLSKITAI